MKKVIIIFVGVSVGIGALGWMGYTLAENKKVIDQRSKIVPASAVPVMVVSVGNAIFNEDLSVIGTIVANSEVKIVSETQGRATGVNFKLGDTKGKGVVLVQIDDELKRANLSVAKANLDKAKSDLDRYEELLKTKAATDAQVESYRYSFKSAESQYITARRQLNDTRITMPVAGTVTSKDIELGSMVQVGTVVANIVDVSRLKVKVNVAEADVIKIKEGQKVTVATDVYPGVQFKGTITTINVKGDEAHTYPVEIALDNSTKNPLRAGMFAHVHFDGLTSRSILNIPREALIGSVKDPQVYVIENNKAVLRSVVIGAETETALEVISGLKEGEQVVLSGHINLRDGVAVQVIK
ncbi:RND family efflux transporter, MFP subunit [Flexibacter flexilis DSM 6793]|uniref:RND family efflux transporter, MFP subunit n=1 Tax=Flexibacter flexilis DSM 6793 TaxID=927664 RepID=A0A1I1HQK7_9BACT|nr:efflux RND transporter periplasmic adaptor subunit [Flexibacter flexilis]SFC25842.1 RND family efflux transporter, MFP subunit [Flexibacter flexilis DSM 6793]